jgi:hypothetical protein
MLRRQLWRPTVMRLPAGVTAAIVATSSAQGSSKQFYVEHGAVVNGGHDDTTGPGGQPADNDFGGDLP